MKPPRNAGLYRLYKYCHSELGVAKTELIKNWFVDGLEINLIFFLIIIYHRLEFPYGLSFVFFERLNSGIAGSNPATLFSVLCFLCRHTCRPYRLKEAFQMHEKAIVAHVFNKLPVPRTTVSLDDVFRGSGHPTVEAVAPSPHPYTQFL